ncbi:ACT domain-containing protein [Fuchsiella alkaliacetigena]|uniref:ACT domain-containing protein n=1 Tax=Fuchsiella alkaliacetigena TaxID=957042 RepID=UPI00200B04C7|nr:ACT domain-containing protein [Fuchsiella alkaliacetigena]MCK8823921.1 ACT domain-containing protein [Fuchsiella alkaliacetigena]
MAEHEYYVVHKDILPTAICKTIEAKRLLRSGELDTVNEAVERVALSRSAYYKYKQHVFPFLKDQQEKIITLSLLLKHESGVLAKVINEIAQVKGNILTINQDIPIQKVANARITLEANELAVDMDILLAQMEKLAGIQKVEVIARNFKY